MMKRIISILLLTGLMAGKAEAQRKVSRDGMSYLVGIKPNNILYRDTIYTGSRQFKDLFYRTHDPELIRLYNKHQTHKIVGNVLTILGSFTTVVGLSVVAVDSKIKEGWVILGSGFITSITGGYLIFRGQQNLATAVVIFNEQHKHRASLGIGVGNKSAGLVLNF